MEEGFGEYELGAYTNKISETKNNKEKKDI